MNTGQCRWCGAKIIWAKTPGGKNMPLDAEPNPRGNLLLDESGFVGPALKSENPPADRRYMSHFATCPDAAKQRKR